MVNNHNKFLLGFEKSLEDL